jgi:hypothetical protein
MPETSRRRYCVCGAPNTERHAIGVLIRHAASDVAGVGQGIRSGTSSAAQDHVLHAIKRVWTKAWHWEFGDNDAFNLRLSPRKDPT